MAINNTFIFDLVASEHILAWQAGYHLADVIQKCIF